MNLRMKSFSLNKIAGKSFWGTAAVMKFHKENNISHARRKLLYLVLFFILFLMLFFPKTAARGALDGLLLWSKTLLPILLPFLILSGLILTLRMTKPFELLFSPIFTHIFPISPGACYPLLIGLLCGMPLGAKTAAALYLAGNITKRDAMFLLGFSNQASMMFLISYVAARELNVPRAAVLVLIVLYSSALIGTAIFILPKYSCNKSTNLLSSAPNPHSGQNLSAPPSFFSALDTSITESFATVTKVGGYVILFSMLSAFTCELPLPTPLSALLSGLLEITSGIQKIADTTLPSVQKTALTLGVTAFGGLSGLMQTKSVTSGTGLSIRHYTFVKLMQGIIAYLLTLLILSFI